MSKAKIYFSQNKNYGQITFAGPGKRRCFHFSFRNVYFFILVNKEEKSWEGYKGPLVTLMRETFRHGPHLASFSYKNLIWPIPGAPVGKRSVSKHELTYYLLLKN